MKTPEMGGQTPEKQDEKPKYKYLKENTIERNGKEVKEFERLCLDPEGRPVTIQKGDSQYGIFSEDYFWRLNPDNYNNDELYGTEDFEKMRKEVKEKYAVDYPEALPLPDELRKLLPEKVTEEYFFSDKDFDQEWTHTHFNELYKAVERGQSSLWGGGEKGGVYIEPSKDGKRVYFCGRGDMACHYFLNLDK